MKIFCIGDIVGSPGREILSEKLEYFKEKEHINLIVANGENASHGNGMSRRSYEELLTCGIDGFTMGNHVWRHKDIRSLMQYNNNIVRPANFEYGCPGKGSMILNTKENIRVGVINIIGRVYMEPYSSPFTAVMREINYLKKNGVNIILVDFHAEATSEKIAMGWYLDGKVSAVFGTHTHVQTADECILPNGTGYITDLGMTGAVYSVLGLKRENVVEKFTTGMPQKFEMADGKSRICGCIFEIDENTGKTVAIKRVKIE